MLRYVLVPLLSLIAVLPAASAHATIYSDDGKIRFVYGNLGEPVYTNVKTGLDIIISDNATGAPITGLESVAHGEPVPPRINVTIRYGGPGGPTKDITNDFRAQFGRAGAYTHPITYTREGLYYLLIRGNINGTFYDVTLAPAHPIDSEAAIMWPDVPADDDSRLDDLESRIEELEKDADGSSPGPGALAIVLAGVVAAILVRRHR
jgi:hypothetical protein